MFESVTRQIDAEGKCLWVNSSLTLIKVEERSRYENIPPGIGFVVSVRAQSELAGGCVWKIMSEVLAKARGRKVHMKWTEGAEENTGWSGRSVQNLSLFSNSVAHILHL